MDSPVRQAEVRLLLDRLANGDGAARKDLAVILYPYLVRAAYNVMRYERKEHTLQPTALAHETIIHLLQHDPLSVETGHHPLSTTLLSLQRQLIEHARRRNSQRRPGKLIRMELRESDLATHEDDEWLVERKQQRHALAAWNAESALVPQSTCQEACRWPPASNSCGER